MKEASLILQNSKKHLAFLHLPVVIFPIKDDHRRTHFRKIHFYSCFDAIIPANRYIVGNFPGFHLYKIVATISKGITSSQDVYIRIALMKDDYTLFPVCFSITRMAMSLLTSPFKSTSRKAGRR